MGFVKNWLVLVKTFSVFSNNSACWLSWLPSHQGLNLKSIFAVHHVLSVSISSPSEEHKKFPSRYQKTSSEGGSEQFHLTHWLQQHITNLSVCVSTGWCTRSGETEAVSSFELWAICSYFHMTKFKIKEQFSNSHTSYFDYILYYNFWCCNTIYAFHNI